MLFRSLKNKAYTVNFLFKWERDHESWYWTQHASFSRNCHLLDRSRNKWAFPAKLYIIYSNPRAKRMNSEINVIRFSSLSFCSATKLVKLSIDGCSSFLIIFTFIVNQVLICVWIWVQIFKYLILILVMILYQIMVWCQ